MSELKEAIYQLLLALLTPSIPLWYTQAPKDTPYPFVTYRLSSMTHSMDSNFSQEFREALIRVECVSDDEDWAARTYSQIDNAISYAAISVPGWTQAGRITFVSMLPDPGDTTPDSRIVFRAGALFNVKLQRQRTDI